jgi:hypothetical protein
LKLSSSISDTVGSERERGVGIKVRNNQHFRVASKLSAI